MTLGYQWEIQVKDDNKGYIADSIQFTNKEGTISTKERSLVQNADILTKYSMDQQCEARDLHINITEPVKPVEPQPTPKEDQKKDEPKPSTPVTSGPGGAVSVVTTTPKVDNPPVVETPKTPATIIPSLPVAPAVKEEKPAFTMEFTDVKETVIQILPKILPKMGAFTGTSRSSNSKMVRDNHGILRTAKENIKLLDTKVNSHDFRLAGSTNTELSHWLQVLDSHEQNLDKYIVIPSIGLVMPIADVSKTDKAYANFLTGKTEHFYDYAGKGAVGIPDIGNDFGEKGNKIIAGHSSWWKDDNSVKYKTHFQKIINLSINTEIWVYEKNTSGEYSRYVYKTTESYNTGETDVSILKQTPNSILTLFTCTPIGGDIGRWVVKAEFVEKH